MLPRARTAAPGALSDDPVVPLVPRRRIAGLPFGDARSVRRGGRFDPIGSRPYRPGDDLRLIDWSASARLSAAGAADELLVREHLAEERVGVGIVVDSSPTMSLYQEGLPWLRKPAAVAEVVRVLAASAARARSPLVRLPGLPIDGSVRALGSGSIVFLVSDFLRFPPDETWDDALARGWDVVPVVVQDPTWEQSFPEVGGVCLALGDAEGRRRPLLLTRREAERRRHTNEERLAEILAQLEALGLEPVLLGSSDPELVLAALLAWADGRRSTFGWTA